MLRSAWETILEAVEEVGLLLGFQEEKDEKDDLQALSMKPLLLPKALPDLRSDEAAWKHLQSLLYPSPLIADDTDSNEVISLSCPITGLIMCDPVSTSDGYVYEREAIIEWLWRSPNGCDTSPMTNLKLANKKVTSNEQHLLKIREFLEKHPDLAYLQYLPVGWIREMQEACCKGDTVSIRNLVQKDKRLLLTRDQKTGKFPLHRAVLHDDSFSTLIELLESRQRGLGLANLLCPDASGKLPLEYTLRHLNIAYNPRLFSLKPNLAAFLNFVAEGEQDKAEAMLKANRRLALQSGTVTDLSGRTFKHITGFQYALWAMDWHMWKMLLNYMPREEAALQLQALEENGTEYGKQFDLNQLIDALRRCKLECSCPETQPLRSSTLLCQQVGGAQLLLPAHVINEYCHPDRSFSPIPDFTLGHLPRVRTVLDSMFLERQDQNDWFSAVYKGGKLGTSFAYSRSIWRVCVMVDHLEHCSLSRWYNNLKRDYLFLRSLRDTRTSQFQSLRADLLKENDLSIINMRRR